VQRTVSPQQASAWIRAHKIASDLFYAWKEEGLRSHAPLALTNRNDQKRLANDGDLLLALLDGRRVSLTWLVVARRNPHLVHLPGCRSSTV
jgi:hypothetical protein